MNALELLQKKRQELANASGKRERPEKIPTGKSRWRILPSWRKEGGQYWHDFSQHFIKDTTMKTKAVYLCVDKTYGRPCKICDALSSAAGGFYDEATKMALAESKSSGGILVNALNLDKDPKKVVLLQLSPSAFGQVCDTGIIYFDEENPSKDPLTDLVDGKDLIFSREGTGFDTKYTVVVAPKSKPVDPAVLSQLYNLDEYVAQEYDAGLNKALAHVSAVTGLLPSPSATARAPMPASSVFGDLDPDDDVPEAPPKKSATETVSKAVISEDELDDLLADL